MAHRTLTLMRHAKSSWNNPNHTDHDRPLNDRGNRDAPEMARRLKERNSIPRLIMCSSAVRTRETAAHLLSVFNDAPPEVQYDKNLYLASPDTMLSLLKSVPDDIDHVMILAHNPGIEDLSAKLAQVYTDTLPTAAIRQFTCASIAGIPNAFNGRGSVADNAIELVYSDFPKNIASPDQ